MAHGVYAILCTTTLHIPRITLSLVTVFYTAVYHPNPEQDANQNRVL